MWVEQLIYGRSFMVAQNPLGHIEKQDVAFQWAYCTHEILNKRHTSHAHWNSITFPTSICRFYPEQKFYFKFSKESQTLKLDQKGDNWVARHNQDVLACHLLIFSFCFQCKIYLQKLWTQSRSIVRNMKVNFYCAEENPWVVSLVLI